MVVLYNIPTVFYNIRADKPESTTNSKQTFKELTSRNRQFLYSLGFKFPTQNKIKKNNNMSFNILNIGEHAITDNSIVSCELHSHPPYANTTFNKSDEIRIPIQTQDIHTLPSKSYLYIEGKLVDAATLKPSVTLQLCNNFLAHLFDEVRYEVAGVVVDRVRNPGITSTLKGLVSFTNNECDRYHHAGWNHLENPKLTDAQGFFSVNVPLKNLMGFFEDFTKILVNIRQELVLLRSSTDLNAYITTKQEEKGQIELHRVLWRIPHSLFTPQEVFLSGTMQDSDKFVKKRLIAKRRNIKTKLEQLRHGEMLQEEMFNPITKRLKSIESTLQNKQPINKTSYDEHKEHLLQTVKKDLNDDEKGEEAIEPLLIENTDDIKTPASHMPRRLSFKSSPKRKLSNYDTPSDIKRSIIDEISSNYSDADDDEQIDFKILNSLLLMITWNNMTLYHGSI
nr:unnamed protein product [Callosobruchus chinensis]